MFVNIALMEVQGLQCNFFWNDDVNPGFKGLVTQKELASFFDSGRTLSTGDNVASYFTRNHAHAWVC